MLSIKINANGKTLSDVEGAIEEVLRLVREEFTSGANSNEDGRFSLDLTGQEDA